MDDGSVLLVEIARRTLSRVGDGRHHRGGRRGGRRAQRRRLRSRRSGVHRQQRRLLRMGGPDGLHHPGARATVVDRRLHPARRPGHAARSPRSTPSATGSRLRAPERHRVRRPRRLLVHRPRRSAPSAPATAPRLHYAQPDGSSIEEVVFPLDAPNGIGLSPDGTALYAAETHTGAVYSWPVTGPGTVASTTPRGPRRATSSPGCPGCRCSTAWPWTVRLGVRRDARQRRHHLDLPDGADRRAHPAARPARHQHLLRRSRRPTAYATMSATGQLVAFDWPRPGFRLHFARSDRRLR